MSFLVGIAGGTGTGKSTVADMLAARYPEKIAIIRLDNYYRDWSAVPRADGAYNVDHPDAIDFDAALGDVFALLEGRTILAPVQLAFPDPSTDHPQSIVKSLEAVVSKQCVILEGHFALYDSRLRNLMARKIYLDLPIRESLARRTKHADSHYIETVLIPMHETYIVPTKVYADTMINLSGKNAAAVTAEVETNILPFIG